MCELEIAVPGVPGVHEACQYIHRLLFDCECVLVMDITSTNEARSRRQCHHTVTLTSALDTLATLSNLQARAHRECWGLTMQSGEKRWQRENKGCLHSKEQSHMPIMHWGEGGRLCKSVAE